MGLFGAVALLLATIGLYVIVARSVSQRQREMGLRMALGADSGRILTLGSGLRLAVAGVLFGVLGAVAGGHFLKAVLFETSPSEPAAILIAVAISLATVILASSIPARRAARLDAKTTLHPD